MGHKVNPTGLRLGFNKNWSSLWFSPKRYAANLKEDFTIRELVNKKHNRSGISEIQINRNRGEIIVSIFSSKPGVIIGRSGSGSQDLKALIEKTINSNSVSSEKQTVRLNIVEVKSSETNAKLIAENIAGQLERRIAFKRAMRQAIEKASEKRVRGIKIRVSGRLGGAEIARSESTSHGSIPLQTIRSQIDYAQAEAHTTYGIVGVKVWVYNGESNSIKVVESNQDHHSRHSKGK